MKKYFLISIVGFFSILLSGCFQSDVPLEKGKIDERLIGKWGACGDNEDVGFEILKKNDREYVVFSNEHDKKSGGKSDGLSMFLTKIDGVYFATLENDDYYGDDYYFGKIEEIETNLFSSRAISNSVRYSKEGEIIKFRSPRQLTDYFFRHMNRKGFYEKTLMKFCRL